MLVNRMDVQLLCVCCWICRCSLSLVAVVAAGVGLLRNRRLIIWVDNAGSVAIWRKGYSNRCMLCTTLVAAIAAVAAAVGCMVELRKVARCSDVGSRLADHLSKGNFGECRQLARQCGWPLAVEPARLPVASALEPAQVASAPVPR